MAADGLFAINVELEKFLNSEYSLCAMKVLYIKETRSVPCMSLRTKLESGI